MIIRRCCAAVSCASVCVLSGKGKLPLLLVLLTVVSVGCAHHHTPVPLSEFDPITEFTSSKSVALINGQPSKEQYKWGHNGVHAWYMNRNEATDVAIQTAKRELTKRGMQVTAEGPKSLTLAITGGEISVGWVRIDTQISMRVTASDGYSKAYYGHDFSVMAGNINSEADTNVMRCVVEMLKDPHIVEFLKN